MGAPARESRISVVIARSTLWAVRVCTNPASCQPALLIVPPRPTKERPYDLWGPWAFREVFYPSSGPGGYPSPTSPRSLGWFWNKWPKDRRSSLQSLILIGNALEISLSGHCFWILSDPVKKIFLLSSFAIIPRNLVFCLRFMLRRSAFCTVGLRTSLGAPKVHPMGVAPELWVDYWR